MKRLFLLAALVVTVWMGLGSATAEATWPRYYVYGPYAGPYRYAPYGVHYGYYVTNPYPVAYTPALYNPYYSYYPYSYTIGWNPYYRFSYVEYPGGYVIGPNYSPGGTAFFRSPARR